MSDSKYVTSNIHNYTIHFENSLSFLYPLLSQQDVIFIIDSKVFYLYPDFFKSEQRKNLILVEAIEENKTLKVCEKIFDKIISLQPTKKTNIISIGGGIVQDISGFVASTFYRGLNWIYVPTTLLAQADSCMGSKTSLNYKSYKNILGTFFPPHIIHIATTFINTLQEEDFYSGIGEIAKLHIMGGTNTFDLLVNNLTGIYHKDIITLLSLTKSSLNIKWTYMEGDEFDHGKRNMLNYGHEFGHAIETSTHYKIPHGQAIVIGMIMANKVALDKKYISDTLNNKLNTLLFKVLKSDYRQLKKIDNKTIITAIKQDKKRIGNNLPLILLNEQFEFFKITDMTEDEAWDVLDFFKNIYCK